MKRRMLTVIMILILMAVIVLPVSPALAEPPVEENWQMTRNSQYAAGFYINTTNLQVRALWIDNYSKFNLRMRVIQRGEVIFEIYSPAYSNYIEEKITNFKFRRMPATYVDDPNSVRYPPNTSIGVDYPD